MNVMDILKSELLKIRDYNKQIDICTYLLDVDFFTKKARDIELIENEMDNMFIDMDVSDMISMSDRQLLLSYKKIRSIIIRERCVSKLTEKYNMKSYIEQMDNFKYILEKLNLCNSNVLFVDFVMEYINFNIAMLPYVLRLFCIDEKLIEGAVIYIKR